MPDHLTDQWPVAPGHEVPQDEWDRIKADADEWSGRTMGALASVEIPDVVAIRYPGAGGVKDSGAATIQLRVIHTAECPLASGYAVSLSRWAADSTVQASWSRMTDPHTVATFVPPGRAAWHATVANPISIGYEQAGYAAFSRDVWMTAEGQASIDRLAQTIVADGIPASDVRRLSDDEVRAALRGDATVRGLCSHAQIQPQDRTDPGAGYPWDYLIARIQHHHPDIDTGDDMAFEPADVWNGVRYGSQTTGDRLGLAAATYPLVKDLTSKVDALSKRLDALSTSGGAVDYDALAAALAPVVADELAKRMLS